MRSNCFVSLFSGAGGLDAGLEASGWTGLYASDIDDSAVATLTANQGKALSGRFLADAMIEHADVRELTGESILTAIGAKKGEIPLLVGGPPCQSWSSAGHQAGFDDPRGRLFSDFVRLAGELGVRWLMFENVRGLLTARGRDGRSGSALEQIRVELLQAGFQTAVSLVNAADYGVAQRRVRLIVFGYRDAFPLQFPLPTHGKEPVGGLLPWVSMGEQVRTIAAPTEPEIIRPSGMLAQQLSRIPPGSGVKSPGKPESTRPGGHWGYKQGAFVADMQKPARTVTANSQQDWIRDADLGLRRLSPRECAAIQSFAADWQFVGKRIDQYRLIGNAVPPKLACALGGALLRHIDQVSAAAVQHQGLQPLPAALSAAILYTERDHLRNGASRLAAPDRRARRAA